ncbi:MAG TPA: alkaline phosphatase family protein [Terriglobales bacterium]|nr:alkaline phosphatase family protein [Terriglobales bacterium]
MLGIDGAAPQVVFRDERLTNLRRLMDLGVYGLLESVMPPTAIPAWTCFSTSQDPGSLGMYGPGDVGELDAAQSPSLQTTFTQNGKKAVLCGIPPATPADIDTTGKTQIKERALRARDDQWQTIQQHFADQGWDFFYSLDTNLEPLQRTFWADFDPKHPLYNSGNPDELVIAEYYQWLDRRIGEMFEYLDDQTIVAVVSAYGAQRVDGAIAMNEWLMEQGLLVLHEAPTAPTRFEQLKVDWSRTRAWSEGGECAGIFFNVEGREARGVVPESQYQSLQADLANRIAALRQPGGERLQSLVLMPDETYRNVRGRAPDLMVEFGGLFYRVADAVGYGKIYLPPSEPGLPACNHSQYGVFIIAAPNCPLQGEYEGARLLDLAPTLLDLAGYEIPSSMQGKSLVAGMEKKAASGGQDEAEAQRLLHERLAGLGYI